MNAASCRRVGTYGPLVTIAIHEPVGSKKPSIAKLFGSLVFATEFDCSFGRCATVVDLGRLRKRHLAVVRTYLHRGTGHVAIAISRSRGATVIVLEHPAESFTASHLAVT